MISVPRFYMRTGVPNCMQFSRFLMKLSSVSLIIFNFREASCFFSHLLHCPCGSIINGHRRELYIIIAFSVEKLSEGRPLIFHSLIFIGSPRTFTRESCEKLLIFSAVLLNFSTHYSRILCLKACVKGPR